MAQAVILVKGYFVTVISSAIPLVAAFSGRNVVIARSVLGDEAIC